MGACAATTTPPSHSCCERITLSLSTYSRQFHREHSVLLFTLWNQQYRNILACILHAPTSHLRQSNQATKQEHHNTTTGTRSQVAISHATWQANQLLTTPFLIT